MKDKAGLDYKFPKSKKNDQPEENPRFGERIVPGYNLVRFDESYSIAFPFSAPF